VYWEEGLIQSEIAKRLGLTQVAVSRLLKKAEESAIVRTTVVTPPGTLAELEEMLDHRFELSQVIIGEAASDSEDGVIAAIGSPAAQFLEATLSL
jgi:DNA-binding transcriptional regulator LsrR (DeoR family)